VTAAGGLAGAGGGLGGAEVAASSKAENGCESASWSGEDACIRDCEVSETAAGKSGAILDILDTREPLERLGRACRLQPAGQWVEIAKPY
jgi:hypothetical protein